MLGVNVRRGKLSSSQNTESGGHRSVSSGLMLIFCGVAGAGSGLNFQFTCSSRQQVEETTS